MNSKNSINKIINSILIIILICGLIISVSSSLNKNETKEPTKLNSDDLKYDKSQINDNIKINNKDNLNLKSNLTYEMEVNNIIENNKHIENNSTKKIESISKKSKNKLSNKNENDNSLENLDSDIKLVYGENNKNNIKIAILADGYIKSEKEKFFKDSEEISIEIFKNSQLVRKSNHFTVISIMVNSTESTFYKNEPIKDSYFKTESENRDSFLPIKIANKNNIYADYYFVLVNTKKFIGFSIKTNPKYTGKPENVVYASSDFVARKQNILHEFGHVIANLSDEYSAHKGTPYHIESKNLTKNKNQVSWSNFMNSSNVGVINIEGTQWYKPTENCIMKGLEVIPDILNLSERKYKDKNFCIVCENAIDDAIDEKIIKSSK